MNSLTNFAATIDGHIRYWSSRPQAKLIYPNFVYHFTDVKNALGILTSGCLNSRYRSEQLSLMKNENAAQDIIKSTKASHKKYARLYFRPRTPTQYRNEGIRPYEDRYLGAHCPVPIFFAFDKKKVLLRDDAHVSNGNMRSCGVVYGRARDIFNNIPFEKVFHNTWITKEEVEEVVFHRHAEVLIPDFLELDGYLSWIGCRTLAERQTLLYQLPRKIADKYVHLIRYPGATFFENSWIYVDHVEYKDRYITFYFNRNAKHKTEVDSVLYLRKSDGSSSRIEKKLIAKASWCVGLKNVYDWVEIELHILDSLAYRAKLYSRDLL